MPMLADIDDPPRSRLPGFLVGALVGLPAVGVVAWLLLPRLMGTVLGGAEDYDQRLRREDSYMQGVCGEALTAGRDDQLCGCVWVAEFPSLDCRHRFLRWSLDRHAEACADEARHREALSFCSCVEVIAGGLAAAEAELGPGETLANAEILKVENCLGLEDALDLPTLEALGAPPRPAE